MVKYNTFTDEKIAEIMGIKIGDKIMIKEPFEFETQGGNYLRTKKNEVFAVEDGFIIFSIDDDRIFLEIKDLINREFAILTKETVKTEKSVSDELFEANLAEEEIKHLYRGKQKSGYRTKGWVYGYFIKGINNCFIVNPKEYEEGYPTASTSTLVCVSRIVDEKTVGRAVGKKDKNGKQIFDGDILKVINGSINGIVLPYVFIVRWDKENSRWKIPNFKGAYEPTHNFEVIGNIHDNPELVNLKYDIEYV